jgi:hypothetical protein
MASAVEPLSSCALTVTPSVASDASSAGLSL